MKILKLICLIWGHALKYDNGVHKIGSPATCIRCGFHQPGITWPRPPYAPPFRNPPPKNTELLKRCEAFISGFEDDEMQDGVDELLKDLRAEIGETL